MEREKPKIKGIWRWVGESAAMVRERERMREKREAWCEKEFQRWREREMRDHGERELIFTHKILISLLQLSYSVILHLESHCSTIAIFFAIVKLYKFCWSGSFRPGW